MQRTPWLNVLIILLVIISSLYLAQLVWQIMSDFASIILLFVLAWLVAFALGPLIEQLNDKPLTPAAIQLGTRVFGSRAAPLLMRYRATRLQAVSIVYLALVLLLIELLWVFIPPTLTQLNQLASQFPSIADRVPQLSKAASDFFKRVGLQVQVQSAIASALGNLESLATPVVQNLVVILTGVLTLFGNLGLVLILSFFFALDGPRLYRTVFDLVPPEFDDEVRVFTLTVDRTFGGFIRAQLIQALAIGFGTAIVMTIFGGQFVLVTSLLAGLFMLIPFVGPVLALIPPFVSTLLSSPGEAVVIVAVLLIYQLVVTNVFMPKLLSDALGLHPLVVIASLLIGIHIGGFWGAFFGVPVAGVIATMALFFYRRWKRIQSISPTELQAEGAVESRPAPAPPPQAAPVRERDMEKGLR